MLLKISTATTVTIGPVLDADGAAVTTAVATNLSLSKNGSSAALTTENLTHVANGYYTLGLTSSNTNTLGNLEVFVNNTAMSMTVFRYNVIAAQVYDSIVSGSDLLQTDVREMLANVITSGTLDATATAEIADAVLEESILDHRSVAHSLAKYIYQIKQATLTIDGIVSNAITPTALTFSSNVVATTSAYAHSVLLFISGPLAGENSPIISYTSTNGVFLLEEALTAAPSNGDEFVVIAGSHVHAIADIQAGLATTANVAAVEADTQDIQSRLPAALVSGRMDSSVGAMVANTITASALATDAVTEMQTGLALESTSQSIKAKTDNLPSDPADASDITAAFTEIKGAEWSSSDTLKEISDSAGAGNIMVTPVVAQVPVRVVGSNIETFIGDLSDIRVGIFSGSDPVNLTNFGDLEVCVQSKTGSGLDFVEMADLTIDGDDSNYVSWTPNGPSVESEGRYKWSLRKSSNKQVVAYGAWIIVDAALEDTGS